MNSTTYVEDTTIKGRKAEIDIKVKRIIELLKNEGLDALYLTRQSNFAWITAGSTNMVTMCTEAGVASILVTKDGDRYAFTDAVEEPRMKEEQKLEALGFKLISQAWYENKNKEFIEEIVGGLENVVLVPVWKGVFSHVLFLKNGRMV